MNSMNIKEVSAIAKVSTATVSRVFSNKKNVSYKTRERILEFAEKYNFRPNQVAGASFGGKTKSIGVLLCRLTNSYFANIAIGIQHEMLNKGYLPIIIDLREDGVRAGIRRLVDNRVDGIIISIADLILTETEISEIVRFELPVVTVDSNSLDFEYDNVCSDDYRGGYLAGEHLANLGHRKMLYCSHCERGVASTQRFEGFRDALSEAGIIITRKNIFELASDCTEGQLDEHLSNFLKQKQISAVYSYNDIVALSVYRSAENIGLKIPEDLSVIGHADLNLASAMTPQLTTIRQDGVDIGKKSRDDDTGSTWQSKNGDTP